MVVVSVCIATHNGERYLSEQLESILCQLMVNDEIVISDDSSTDNTLNIIRSFNDPRIRLFEGNKFYHHTQNFENAISKAIGDVVFLSDQDDVWVENKVSIMLKWLANCNLVVSECFVVDENLKVISNNIFNSKSKQSGFIRNLCHNHYLGCCMAFDREVIDLCIPFPKGILSHESWIGSVASFFGKTKFISDCLIYFRRHQFNNSNTLKGSTLSFKQKLTYRIVILYNIFKIFARRHLVK